VPAFAAEHLSAGGLREPHWHPNASELDYLVSGHVQIGLVAPDCNLQTVSVGPGDIAFLPENWCHYIASVSDVPLQILIFFLTPDPRVETITCPKQSTTSQRGCWRPASTAIPPSLRPCPSAATSASPLRWRRLAREQPPVVASP
jgi:uncharacterized cupin superfamily protein